MHDRLRTWGGVGAETSASVSIGVDIAGASASVMADTSIALSPQATILLNAATQVMGSALGGVADATITNVSKAVADMAAQNAVSTVSDIAGQIPLIGAIVGWAAFVIGDILGMAEKEAQARAQAAQQCADAFSLYKPIGTGAGGRVMPCDILGCYDADDAFRLGAQWDPNRGVVASVGPSIMGAGIQSHPTLGAVLIRLTESPDVMSDPNTLWNRAHGKLKDGWPVLEDAPIRTLDYDALMNGVRVVMAQAGKPNVGIPKKRREIFRKLRLAIGRQRKYSPHGSTDGGSSLWPAYLDLLRQEVDAGHITPELVSYLWAYNADPKMKGLPMPGACANVASAAGRSVWALVDSWRQTVNPWYSTDAKEQKALQDQARQIILLHMMRFPKGTREYLERKRRKKLIKAGKAGAVLTGAAILAKLYGLW